MTTTLAPPTTPPRIEVRPATAADILLAAATYIDEHGWARSEYRYPSGAACAVGAINTVVGWALPDESDHDDDTPRSTALRALAGSLDADGWCGCESCTAQSAARSGPGFAEPRISWWNGFSNATEVTETLRTVAEFVAEVGL